MNRPASLWLILGLLQLGASVVFYLKGYWIEAIVLAFTAAGTLIGWYIRIKTSPGDIIIEERDVSVNFSIKPGAPVILSSEEYQNLVPAICSNIGVKCNAKGDGLYNLVHNSKEYRFSIELEQIVNIANNTDNQEIGYPTNTSDKVPSNYKILSCVISYPLQRITMNGLEFKKKLQAFVQLVKQLSTQFGMNPKFSNVNVTGAITVWQYIAPDGVYDIQFRKKLNNLFKVKFLHTVALSSSSGEEKCTFGRDYTEFVFPLRNFPRILSNIVNIIWYT